MADKWLGAHVAGEFDVFIRGQRQSQQLCRPRICLGTSQAHKRYDKTKQTICKYGTARGGQTPYAN